MQRWVTTLVGFAVVAFAVWLVGRGFHAPRAVGYDSEGGADGGAETDARYASSADAAQGFEDAAPLLLSDLPLQDLRVDGGPGTTMIDGTPVPMLPVTAPRQVRFGVALVSYAGAQPSPAGGHPATRSRAEAKNLADHLAASAREDFHAAVQQGDPGSADDLGTVRLGVLEPAPEYVLFTLPVAGVGGPVDTPRGYWIVKRLE
jgi:hypothetical protein